MRTTAVKDGDEWVLNGTKNFITNATYADISVVLAVTDRNDQKHGITAFAVEMDRKGIRPGKKENKLGMRVSDTAELVMEDCRVPDGEHPRRDRLRLHRRDEDARRRPHLHRRARRRHRARRVRGGARLRQAAHGVRQADRRVPGHPVHARRHGHRDRRGAPALPSRRDDQGRRREGDAVLGDGQALRLRGRRARDGERRADLRRLRLHQGVPGREVLPRREALHDRRGDARDPAHGHRAQPARAEM